tara:strand:+ start:629 stop:1297 length:669 start_codon:yes stop_codon:yes gene_type:complete
MSAAAATKLLTGTKMAGRFKDFMPLLMSSMPGALFSGGFATLTTGNPLAGLTVAGADLLGSTALASGIGLLGKKKILGKTVNFAGGPAINIRGDVPENIKQEIKRGVASPDFQSFMASKTGFAPSPAQTVGQVAGSIGAVLAVEPMFYPKPQGEIVSQQLNQRLGFDALSTNLSGNPMTVQGSSTDPRLVDGAIRKSDTEYPGGGYATGTLYQVGGTPMRGM